ncbi:MAG: hypothetical protein M3Q12_00585 [Pseudomonadota bacterium]|uniref:hypothetical protein n=1 Tax=Polaromonas sp. TaxID=1869339 RepID=UPI0018439037|nr:hypothetical protein [Polaromonas sp.]MBA3595149.1 hypothetical protein [Polaromonas sp.]MDQ3270651.1 hypothetical protein [Pseudomonadota bacterium]
MFTVSAAKWFLPNAGTCTLVAPASHADPSRGKQLEPGLMADWLDGRLRINAAVDDLRKTIVPTPSPANPLFSD